MTGYELIFAKGEAIGYRLGKELIAEQGMEEWLVKLTFKKLIRGYTVDEIADMLEEDEKTISKIVESIRKYAMEYDMAVQGR